jgi:serine/threonine protein kinase
MDVPEQGVSTLFPLRRVEELRPTDPQVLGLYVLVCRLPSGGMGADVFIARGQPHQEEHVVLKTLLADAYPRAVDRFTTEARNAALVSSSRVAAVLDVQLEGERPYYVQQYVDGTPLSELVEQGGALDAEELRRLAVGLLLALMDVHAVQVAHRDVKPGNIIITADGDVVLVDFGISRETDERGEFSQTEAINAALTRLYAAPEQMQRTGTLTQAVDVYAWAMVIAFASLGRHPVDPADEMSPADYIYALERGEFDLTRLPASMVEVVRDALAFRPRKRPTVHRLFQQVDSATRWTPPTQRMELAIGQPGWSVAELRSPRDVLLWLRYLLSAFERSVLDTAWGRPALRGAAVALGGLLGVILAALYYAIF